MNDRIQQLAEKYTANCLNEATANAIRQIIITALQEYSAWQPIDTAPKDGTRILALWKEDKEPTILFFDTGDQAWTDQHEEFGPFELSPIKWQPLPELPAP